MRSPISPHKLFLISNGIVNAGALLTISAGFWDVMNHLLNRPETFFSPPHAALYSGVAIALIGSVLMFLSWRGLSSEMRSAWRLPFKIGIVGIFVLVSAGPIDFTWHSYFGLDGLLSPPHQVLVTGMFLCSISSVIAIVRYATRYHGYDGRAMRAATLALLAGWMSTLGYLYSFSLPFSNTEFFQFNPDIWFAVSFATITMPFTGAIVLALASRLVRYRFGVISCLGGAFLAVNGASMLGTNPALFPTIPFFFLAMIPLVAADIIMSSYRNARGIAVAGGIIGPLFYFMYFPYVTYVYNEVIFIKVISGSVTFQVFFDQLPFVLPLIAGPAVVMGIIGAVLSKRIMPVITGEKERAEATVQPQIVA